jgi:excinuclease UvrABC nuclease subunit|tara:strand:- start:6 stop:398 length:393 start_codon:yes stop_codon:yes gene_type:complete
MNINYNKLVSKDVRNYYLYFLFINKILIYIGQTAHLNSRLVAHKGKRVRNDTPYKKYTHYYYIKSTSDYLSKKWEKILIKKWCPKYNIGHNNDAKFRKVWIEQKGKSYEHWIDAKKKRILGHWRYLEKKI